MENQEPKFYLERELIYFLKNNMRIRDKLLEIEISIKDQVICSAPKVNPTNVDLIDQIVALSNRLETLENKMNYVFTSYSTFITTSLPEGWTPTSKHP